MPYENYICITEITGNEIFKMIKTVQNGKRGYQPTSGLKQFIKVELLFLITMKMNFMI